MKKAKGESKWNRKAAEVRVFSFSKEADERNDADPVIPSERRTFQ